MTREELSNATDEELVDELDYCGYDFYYNEYRNKVKEEIKKRMKTDVHERVHGKWITEWNVSLKMVLPYCSACRAWSVRKFDFCPNCGADTREVEDDN